MNLKISRFIIIIPIFFALLASHRLWRSGYFSMQDDMHVFRLQQFHQCILDWQIPCRLIPDGGFGYSYPLFNFYSPISYAFAEIFHLLNFSIINSLKISFIIPYFIGAVGMYLLSNSFFGPFGGLVGSVLFTFAPYHAVNGFVRGALAEHWAINLIPLVLYLLYVQKSNYYILFLTILLLSHNLTVLYFLPLLLIFAWFNKRSKFLFTNSGYSFLISSFFLIPAFFEKNLTTVATMTQGYFQYIIHFATLNQLFISRFWGYGASLWGPIDDMSFQIGYMQWILPLIALFFVNKSKLKNLLICFYTISIVAIFLTHNRSTFIWQTFQFMAFYQFPWRFLGLATFCLSFLGASLTKNKYFTFLIILLTIILNINYFREDIWYPNLTDTQKLTSAEIFRQSGAGLQDYWSISGDEFPTNMAINSPQIVNGQISENHFLKSSNQASGTINVISPSAIIELPITHFPNWDLYVDNKLFPYTINPQYGQIRINLTKGYHQYRLKFTNTPIRTLANLISLIGLTLFIIKIYHAKNK